MKHKKAKFLEKEVLRESLVKSIAMLKPSVQFKNPVMFIAYISAITTTVYILLHLFSGKVSWFELQITLWLWFTVLFANFAQALAESRGKAHAASLRKSQTQMYAKRIWNHKEYKIPICDLKKGDIVLCEAGDMIPADGEVIEGMATVDESAITGESAPVIRESGGDRSAVTAGTKILSDSLHIKVTSEIGNSFLDRIINLIEGAKRQKTPNEIALSILLSALTLIFILTTSSVKFFADYSSKLAEPGKTFEISLPILIALLVCLIPTTISALLNAVGIAGMDRLVRRNVVAKSGRSVEAAGDIDLLILDKTGTITIGNRMATALYPIKNLSEEDFAAITQIAALCDETPEGRSLVALLKNKYGLKGLSLTGVKVVPFTAKTRMSGIDFIGKDGNVEREVRKGSADAIRKHIESLGGVYPDQIDQVVQTIAKTGGTPLLVSDNEKVVGAIELKDIVKTGIRERFSALRKMGIRTVMVTGDNSLTAATIAAEAGVDDYVAEATPEIKLALIKREQDSGRLVAMAGDGTNDAPALAQSDVAVAMNNGTQASREAGNMVDLDSDPTKLIDIVEIGKQLLMTRGALTTFSIANDVSKYFAIIPAIFNSFYLSGEGIQGPLEVLNIMFLHSPKSAILSAVIFNALVIIALIPLALKGVAYKPKSADELLLRNICIYGIGGIIVPFIGIKLIDMIIAFVGMAI